MPRRDSAPVPTPANALRTAAAKRAASASLWVSLAVFAWILGSTSWICDDAFISFRSVEQLIEGNGPRWNPHERVQAFTHPLWFGAVASARVALGDPPLAAKVLSFVLALATFWLVAGRLRTSVDRVLLLLALALGSRAFVDFSSSGLEDPLSHLLLAIFALVLLGRLGNPLRASLERLQRAGWAAGLLLLCRHDNLWLVAPPMLWLGWSTWRRDGRTLVEVLLAAVPGFVPFGIWTLFSVVYYGFPIPNTAYAKLNTGVAGHDLWQHGVQYLTHTATWDPVTISVVFFGAALWLRRGRLGGCVAFGMALHVLYVVRVGGDFMAGRFFTETFVLGLCTVLLYAPRSALRPALAVTAAFLAFWPLSPFRISDAYRSYDPDDHHGIADERAFYSGRNSYQGFDRRWPIALWRLQAQRGPQEHFEVGFSAFAVGTDKIVIDRFALADPLLARLPADDDWKRIGHFRRSVPAGYVESLRSGTNQIANPYVHRLYDDLKLVTQGPLFSAERWAAIWRLNVAIRRPGCLEPPCRKLVTHVLPPQLFAPLLPRVEPDVGGLDRVVAQGDDPRSFVVEGRVPFGLLDDEQLIRLFLPEHPASDALDILPGQDPAGDLRGFRAVLTFDDDAAAERVIASTCAAVAAEGGRWQLLPRLDAGGAVCARLALEP